VKRAPVKEPKNAGALGAKVTRRAPAQRGNVIMPPGTRSRNRLMGKDTDVPLLGSNFYDCNRVWIETYGEVVRVGKGLVFGRDCVGVFERC
jgi:hypothetical protein